MKTNFKSEKQNNVQKTVLKSAVVVVSFILISFTVSGQDFLGKFLETSHSDAVALAMAETSKETNSPVHNAGNETVCVFEEAKDPVLKVEPWMYNNNCFEVLKVQNREEKEMELQIEGWMLNENLFKVDKVIEMPLEIEGWMISEKTWAI